MNESQKTKVKKAELAELENRLQETLNKADQAAQAHRDFIAQVANDIAGGVKPKVAVTDDRNLQAEQVYRQAAAELQKKISKCKADLFEIEKADALARRGEIEAAYRESVKVIIQAFFVASQEQKKLHILADEGYGIAAKFHVGGVNLVNDAVGIASLPTSLLDLYQKVPELFVELGIKNKSWL